MAAELMLINPRRRRRAAHKRRKLSPLQQKYFGKSRKRRAVTVVQSNPRRKHRRARVHHRRRTIHVRRNPISGNSIVSLLKNTVAPAAIGAVAGVGIDYMFNNLPLPQSLQSGILNPISRIGVAILLGVGVGSVSNKTVGTSVAVGGSVVALYNFITQYTSGNLGGINGMKSSNYGINGMGRYTKHMGRYPGRAPGNVVGMAAVRRRRRNLGYVGPGRGAMRMRARGAMLVPGT